MKKDYYLYGDKFDQYEKNLDESKRSWSLHMQLQRSSSFRLQFDVKKIIICQ